MIRKFKPADTDDLLDVWQKASAIAHPFLCQAFLERESLNIRDIYLPAAETWVWESGGRVIGFISIIGNEVGGLFVTPTHWGKGIGRALMDKARERRGVLELDVFTANAIGRAFYEKYGFKLARAKVDEETGFDVLRLRLAQD